MKMSRTVPTVKDMNTTPADPTDLAAAYAELDAAAAELGGTVGHLQTRGGDATPAAIRAVAQSLRDLARNEEAR